MIDKINNFDELVSFCRNHTVSEIESLKEKKCPREKRRLEYQEAYKKIYNKESNEQIDEFFKWTQCENSSYNKWYYNLLCDLLDNIEKYEEVYLALEDYESRKIYFDICYWRLSMRSKYLLDAFDISKDYSQYFDKIACLKSDEVIVEGGGFIGDTVQDIYRELGGWQKIFFYEPDNHNLQKAMTNLKEFNNIDYRQFGLGKENGSIYFESNGTSSSKVSEMGEMLIKIEAIDTSIKEKITFIKLDIEGQELAALKGAKNHIICDRPVLAISLYHNIEDMYSIPQYVMEIVKNYKYYVRHYRCHHGETVFYAIPKERIIENKQEDR